MVFWMYFHMKLPVLWFVAFQGMPLYLCNLTVTITISLAFHNLFTMPVYKRIHSEYWMIVQSRIEHGTTGSSISLTFSILTSLERWRKDMEDTVDCSIAEWALQEFENYIFVIRTLHGLRWGIACPHYWIKVIFSFIMGRPWVMHM